MQTILIVLNLILLAVVLVKLFSQRQEDPNHVDRLLRDELARNREELNNNLKQVTDSLSQQLIGLTQINENKLEKLREVIESNLRRLQDDNGRKLDQMREIVDEKLHATLEKRLGESFKLVSDRLEKVHMGLGEMQTLALGVGDLKKVLTNVKTRGTWGEITLGNLLEQILTPEQYAKNIVTKKTGRDPVEFAIKLPGHGEQPVWLPIDAKFPKEDYERLQLAQDEANLVLLEEAGKALESRVKLEAKKICEKYIDPPQTTDFAILFLPIEGLYAEVLRRPGLCEGLQREYRIIIAGPTTIMALLNSLQMGFRTLTVEKRASEVWTLLGKVRNEFGKFGDLLDKTHKKLQEASNTIQDAASKSRTIESKLSKVQSLSSDSADLPASPIESEDANLFR